MRIPAYACKVDQVVISIIANSFSIVSMLNSNDQALIHPGNRCGFHFNAYNLKQTLKFVFTKATLSPALRFR